MTNAHSTSFSTENYTTKINWMLFIGIAISNTFFGVFLLILAIKVNPNQHAFFVRLELASWFLGTFSAFTLIGSTLYTSWVLRNLYGADFKKTSLEILLIGGIFVLAFASRSTFEWVMFDYYLKQKSETVINMIEMMAVFMPIIWDLLPITTILILHHENYSRKANQREELLGKISMSESNQFDIHESFIDLGEEINGPHNRCEEDDMNKLQKSVKERLKQNSSRREIAVERNTCYLTSPKVNYSSDLNFTSHESRQRKTMMQERVSKEMCDPSTSINDNRNVSLNFLGLLDSRKTAIAISKRRATLSSVPNEAAQPKSEDLTVKNAETSEYKEFEQRGTNEGIALLSSGFGSLKSMNSQQN